MRAFLLLGLTAVLSPILLAAPVQVYKLWTQASLVDAAAVHISTVPYDRQKYVRYAALNAIAPEVRGKHIQAMGFVSNSWSRSDLIALAQPVPGTENALVWFDLGLLKIDPKVFDRLAELGSGPAPFPEPIFHAVTRHHEPGRMVAYTERIREVNSSGQRMLIQNQRTGEWEPSYVTVTRYREVPGVRKLKVLLGGHLNKATAIGLAATTQSEFPIFDYRWLLANGLVEPRYHELLGLDDTEASARKLAAVNEAQADKLGAQIRGAVLFSDVAHHNRILERTPTLHRQGRCSFHRSLDFKTSLDVDDALKDGLNAKPAAFEIIFNLPCGLLAFFVADAAGKRLDKADGDIAANRRGKFRDPQVRTCYHCLDCHLGASGWIEVKDEVRQMAKQPITLLADAMSKTDPERGNRLRQKYLAVDFNELLLQDKAIVDSAVKAATGGLTCPETRRLVIDTIYTYLETPVTLAQLSLELGYPQEQVAVAARTPGLDHVFAGLLAGRPQRRDQIEFAFAQIATILHKGVK